MTEILRRVQYSNSEIDQVIEEAKSELSDVGDQIRMDLTNSGVNERDAQYLSDVWVKNSAFSSVLSANRLSETGI